MRRIKQCNILLIGDTGVGKSTLIQTLLNVGDSISNNVTSEIKAYKHSQLPFCLYDSPGLEWKNKKTESGKKQIIDFIKKQNKLEPKDQIHVVWYCVNSQVTRQADIDNKWIQDVSDLVPVIAVITKSLDKKDKNLRNLLQETQCIRNTSSVMAEPTPTVRGNVKQHGCQNLLHETETLLNEIAERAIQNAIRQKKIVAVHWCALGLTGVIGAQFAPFVKSKFSAGLQVWMLHDITKNFGHSFSKKDIKQLLQVAGIYSFFAMFDGIMENVLSHLPGLDYNNIQSVQQILDHVVSIIGQNAEIIPFKENIIEILQQLSGVNLIANLPALNVLSALEATFSTIVLAAIWIAVMEDYTKRVYEGQDVPNLNELLSQKFSQAKEFLTSLLGQVELA